MSEPYVWQDAGKGKAVVRMPVPDGLRNDLVLSVAFSPVFKSYWWYLRALHPYDQDPIMPIASGELVSAQSIEHAKADAREAVIDWTNGFLLLASRLPKFEE